MAANPPVEWVQAELVDGAGVLFDVTDPGAVFYNENPGATGFLMAYAPEGSYVGTLRLTEWSVANSAPTTRSTTCTFSFSTYEV